MTSIMDTMERTLHVSQHTGPLKVKPRKGIRKMRWPAELRRPIEAAMHLDSNKPLPPSRFKGAPQPIPNFFG